MDLRIKNALGVVGVVAIALAAVVAVIWAQAFLRSAPSYATFSVSGQGKAVGVPDVAQFTFSVVTEGGEDIAALQTENTQKANAAINLVKSQGVEDKDIETLAYDVQPRYQSFDCRQPIIYRDLPVSSGAPSGSGIEPAVAVPDARATVAVEPCPPSEIVGYTVTQTVQVKMRDFSRTDEIISGVTSSGANVISGLNFTVDDPTALQNESRGKAIQDARGQAEAMAEAGGFRLGRLIGVSEDYYQPFYGKDLALQAEDSRGGGSPAPAPDIQPGSLEFTSHVNLTYEIR